MGIRRGGRHRGTGSPGFRRARVAALLATVVLALPALSAPPLAGQLRGRAAVETLEADPLRFRPPEVQEKTLSNGVTVFYLRDTTTPLVSVFARFSGGFARFPRGYFGPASALPAVLRSGGTTTLEPDSVDRLLEFYAIQTSFGGSGNAVSSSMNTLTRHLETAMEVWGDLLRNPGFDTAAVQVWRGRELEDVRRQTDNPARLAYAEFNRLMYGDHPVGWEMTEADLAPEKLVPERFRWLRDRILCPDRLILGVVGDVSWDRMEALLEGWTTGWAPCAEPLPDGPEARVGAPAGVYLIPRELDQSTVVVAQPHGLHQSDSPEYFASRIGNAILGASGFSSRLVERLRTREGLTYGASSLWTTPRRYDGLLGATTRTRTETTRRAIDLLLSTLLEMGEAAPEADEVQTTVDEAVNGFVFNFQSPAQIVTRRMSFRASGLPDDWLERYVEGIQGVEPREVRAAFRAHLDPGRMVVLVVGDEAGLARQLEGLGPVRRYPSEWPRCRTSGADTRCR